MLGSCKKSFTTSIIVLHHSVNRGHELGGRVVPAIHSACIGFVTYSVISVPSLDVLVGRPVPSALSLHHINCDVSRLLSPSKFNVKHVLVRRFPHSVISKYYALSYLVFII